MNRDWILSYLFLSFNLLCDSHTFLPVDFSSKMLKVYFISSVHAARPAKQIQFDLDNIYYFLKSYVIFSSLGPYSQHRIFYHLASFLSL